MTWLGSIPLEPAVVVGSDPLVTMRVGVAELTPSEVSQRDTGQTRQSVSLLLPTRERLDPPTRLMVRGKELRVLGTQVGAWPTAPSVVTCERVNANLPDLLRIVSVGDRVLDPETARYTETETTLWEGAGHVVSGIPSTVDLAGEDAPLDRVTVTVPLAAPYAVGLRLEVVEARTPGLTGRHFTASGEVLDSDAELRRFIAYRPGA